MTDERNFRSSYYEKVGNFKFGVEEKKSLNKLLQDNIRNHAKLKQFSLCYSVPTTERPILWQLVLGILPLHRQSTEFVWEQREAVFEDLLNGVKWLTPERLDAKTPKSRVFFYMWLLENNRILHYTTATDNDNNFLETVQALLQIFDNEIEVYWIAKELFGTCMKDIRQECPKLKEMTQIKLKRDDLTLYNHLEKLDVFSNKECIDKWYSTGFASLLSESALVKVFDKIVGGSTKVVVNLFIELVKTFRERILNCESIKDFKSIIEKVKEQDTTIVKRALSITVSDSEMQKTSLTELKDIKK